MNGQDLKIDRLLTGDMVSVDYYISGGPGSFYHTIGKSDQNEIFLGFFSVDHASGFMRINNKVVINPTLTVNSKLLFESKAQGWGV